MKILQAFLFMAMVLFGPQVMSQPGEQVSVGKVMWSVGEAYLKSDQGAVAAKAGTPVFVGQTVFTKTGGNASLSMMDGAFLSLRSDSSLTIKKYHVDLVNPANTEILLETQKGVLRSITGKGGKLNKQGFRLNTPVAAIGIRGTDFTVFTDDVDSRVTLREGAVVVSPFSALCSKASVGACTGAQAVILAAYNQQVMAEVSAAGQKAILVDKDKGVAPPDVIAPPHPQEEKNAQEVKETPVVINNPTTENTEQKAQETTAADQDSGEKSAASDSANAGGEQTSASTAPTGNDKDTAGTTATTPESTGNTTGDTNSPTTSTAPASIPSTGVAAKTVATVEASGTTTAPAASPPASTTTPEVPAVVVVPTPVPVVMPEIVTPPSIVPSSAELASEVITQATATESINTIISPEPPVVTPTPVVTPVASAYDFGRWSTFVENSEQDIESDPVRNARVFTTNTVYKMGSLDTTPVSVTQKSGTANFDLKKGEAVVKIPTGLVTAEIANPRLAVNFDNSSFSTGMDVKSAALSDGVDSLYANGTLAADTGALVSTPAESNMSVTGDLSNDGSQAGYLFEQAANEATLISGATTWLTK